MSGGDDQDLDFATLLAEHEREAASPGRREPRPGEMVQGRVVSIGHDAAFVDLGGKAEGVLDLAELRDADGSLIAGVGDVVEARVVEVGGKAGCVVLRRSLATRGPEARAELEQAWAHGIPVEGTVGAVNKGGVEVQVAGLRAFCPLSQLDARPVDDVQAFVGQRLRFRITALEPGRRGEPNVVLSRRALLEEEARARAAETRARLAVGLVVRGTVTALKEYGAFVDLGGVEAMLHVSELGFARVGRPADVLAVGQEIEAVVVRIEPAADRRRPERIALSLKALERDPWQDVAERFPEGARARGTVARVEPYGAFVELAPGLEGLLHVSELGGGRRLRHAREAATVGEPIDVTVLAVDLERRRLSLGVAAPEEEGAPIAAPRSPGFGTLGDLLGRKRR